MALSKNRIYDIKKIIQDFIKNNAFNDSEAHIQSSFIQPLLEAIGWSSAFWKINPPQDIKTAKRPDILLKGEGGGTIFAIESKAANKSLDDKYPKWSFTEQTCFYIDSEGVSWGILTNFKEWRIYNSHAYKLNKTAYSTIKLINENGIFVATDKQIEEFFGLIEFYSLNEKRGKIALDAIYYPKQEEIKSEFFVNLKKWRSDLRNQLYNTERNVLTPEEIDNQTQRILDRLIFIDVCYDKEVLSQNYLGAILFSEGNFYDELKRIFKILDEKFNSELFAKDKCDAFNIPNSILTDIVKGINYTDFSLLSVHIIGEVYENYLGELISGGKKKIKTNEGKEQLKRKEQGIYYTPDYVASYIIENTVGEALKKCKTANEIEKIKVLDSACGSGSFLIRAFDVFMAAYKRVNAKKQLGIFDELNIRKKILLHNLFGVDFDERAVEITKLNLLLKALDKLPETNITGRKVLPNLSLNIRCGNSLVSGRYVDDESKLLDEKNQMSFLFDKKSEYKGDISKLIDLKEKFYKEEGNEEKEKLLRLIKVYEEKINRYINKDLEKYFSDLEKIRPFNYEVAFCEVMSKGGFTCVIGNPPYLKLTSSETDSEILQYYNDRYKTIHGGSSKNLFQLFTERMADFEPEYFSYIVPEALLTTASNGVVRKILLDRMNIKSIAIYDHFVFDDATIGSTVFVANNKRHQSKTTKHLIDKAGEIKVETQIAISKKDDTWGTEISDELTDVIAQIEKNTKPLGILLSSIAKGMAVYNRDEVMEDKKTKSNYPFLLGKNIGRYTLNYTQYATYDRLIINGGTNKLEKHIKVPRLLIRRTGNIVCATYSDHPELVESTIYIATAANNVNLKFLLAVLNSKLLTFYLRKKLLLNAQGYPQVLMGQLEQLPIRQIDSKKKTSKDIHDKLIKLADDLLLLYQNPVINETKIIAREIEIDELIFKLYEIDKKNQKLIFENMN